MHIDLLIHSASQLLQLTKKPQRGHQLGTLNLIHKSGVAIHQGEILEVGVTDDLRKKYRPIQELSAEGKLVMPGFVDPHTHLLWVGDRAEEFERRIAGASYLEIMQAGGGIMSTVRKCRAASIDEMVEETRPRLREMLAHGTTTAEAKTGYGLETETELRMLAAITALDVEGPLELIPTFLGAHTIPEEFAHDPSGYADLIEQEMLPAVKKHWVDVHPERRLPFVDVFCETGAFTLQQSEKILAYAKSMGFPLKIHADEFDGLGGTGMAVRLSATSADHLVHTPAEDIRALGASETVAVALPCTPFGLAERDYTPAQDILEAGGLLAIATDLNPGTAWCENMQFAIALACRYMKLTPSQAIAAATINAAAAIDRQEDLGSLHAGKQADLLLMEISDYRQLGYRFGTNLVSAVVKKGEIVYSTLKEA